MVKQISNVVHLSSSIDIHTKKKRKKLLIVDEFDLHRSYALITDDDFEERLKEKTQGKIYRDDPLSRINVTNIEHQAELNTIYANSVVNTVHIYVPLSLLSTSIFIHKTPPPYVPLAEQINITRDRFHNWYRNFQRKTKRKITIDHERNVTFARTKRQRIQIERIHNTM